MKLSRVLFENALWRDETSIWTYFRLAWLISQAPHKEESSLPKPASIFLLTLISRMKYTCSDKRRKFPSNKLSFPKMERSAVTPANNNLAISFGAGSLLSFQDLVQKMWNSETFVFRGSSGRTESVNNPINHSLEEKPTWGIVREKGKKEEEENILQTFSLGSHM